MNTYLLTWNPNKWQWDLETVCEEMRRYGFLEDRWSCGRTKRIRRGDRVFLMRQGEEPRGIMAAGAAWSEPFYAAHWDNSRDDEALYIKVRFDSLLHPEQDGVFPRSALLSEEFAGVNWNTQSSGIEIPPTVAEHLEYRWNKFLIDAGDSPIVLPDEIVTPEAYYEGASRRIYVNRYERDPKARRACIDHYKAKCFVCKFDFGKVYGQYGAGFIHVHHVVPLHTIGEGYQVDPIDDLRPLCPNCHAMIHRNKHALTIEQLLELVAE